MSDGICRVCGCTGTVCVGDTGVHIDWPEPEQYGKTAEAVQEDLQLL